MRKGSYAVTLTAGEEKLGGYWSIPNDTQYGITVQNDTGYLAEADIKVNGALVGTFVIKPGSNTFWHPAEDMGIFTALSVESEEARQSGNSGVDQKSGLVEVDVYPCAETGLYGIRVEKYRERVAPGWEFSSLSFGQVGEAFSKSPAARTPTSGTHTNVNTVLTGESSQRYVNADPLTRIGSVVKFALRLVAPRKPARKVYRALTNDPPPPLL